MSDKRTTEEIQAKADALTQELKVPVTPLCFTTKSGEQVVGFVKEPNRSIKLAAIDKMMQQSPTLAGEMIVENCLIEEHSDSRILSDDNLFVSAVLAVVPLIEAYQNEVKKK